VPPAPSTSEAEPPDLGPVLVYLARDPSLALAAAMIRHPEASGVLVAAPTVGFSSPSAEHLSFHFPGWIKIPPVEREPASALLDLVISRRARSLLLLAVFPDSPSSQSTKNCIRVPGLPLAQPCSPAATPSQPADFRGAPAPSIRRSPGGSSANLGPRRAPLRGPCLVSRAFLGLSLSIVPHLLEPS
jgi:hypothetical protein